MGLVHGLILKGTMCPYIDECEMKHVACNGEGCPFAHDKTAKVDFSCGYARFLKLCNKVKRNDKNEVQKI